MKKRIIAGILAFSMLLGTAACGKNSGEGSTSASGSAESEDVKDKVYEESNISIDGYKGTIETMTCIGDDLVFCSEEYLMNGDEASLSDADIPVGTIRVYEAPKEGGTAKLLLEETETTKNVNRVFNAGDNIGLWMNDVSSTGKETGSIVILDRDGKELKNIDLSKAYSEMPYISQAVYVEEDDAAVVFGDEVIKIIDSTGNEKATITNNGYLMSAGLTKDNVPIASIYTDNGEDIKTIDVKNGAFKDSITIDSGNFYSDIRSGFGDYDIVYSTKSAVFGYNLSEKKETRICDFTASDIDTTSMTDCVILDDSTIAVYSHDYENDSEELNVYTKIDSADYVEKKELTMMCLYVTDDIRKMVLDFNKSHDEYRIKILNYSEADQPYDKMSADIAAGNFPDIYYINGGIGNMSTEQCAAKGMFEDLTPYIEKDPEISESDLVPSIYEAMKINGKTYYLGSHFSIITLLGKKSDLGDKTGWTFDELKQYVESKPEDSRIFETSNKGDVLNTFLSVAMKDYVDWEKGECYFDSPEFKSILELSNRGTKEATNWDDFNYVQDVKSGKQLLVEGYMTPDELSIYNGILGGEIAYIGYPDKNKNGGVYASISNMLAISSVSENKDVAWDFVKQLISRDFESENYWNSIYGCPLRKDIYEMYLNAFTTTTTYTDEFGNKIEPRKGTIGMTDLEVEKKPLTTDEINQFKSLVDRVSQTWSWDTSLNQIISEEAAAYFAGDKTVDETASLIQNRAATYVQENK